VFVVTEMLCKFRISTSILKVLEMFLESYTKRPASLSNIFFIAVMTC